MRVLGLRREDMHVKWCAKKEIRGRGRAAKIKFRCREGGKGFEKGL